MNRLTGDLPRSGFFRSAAMIVAALGAICAQPALAQHQLEAEPNNTVAEANPIPSSPAKITADIWREGDIDIYSFQATAGSRVYAATMTNFSPNLATDSYLELLGPDGVTVIEFDNNDGALGASASSLAGVAIPADGTYYLLVRYNTAFTTLRAYDLYFRLQEGTPATEVEPNDTFNTPQLLPENGWVTGELSSLTDEDFYGLSVNAGDTIVVSLDLEPERDGVEWNAILGIGTIGGSILTVNDNGAAAGPDSESHHITVKGAGDYYVRVTAAPGGTTFGAYGLSVSVIPAQPCPSGNANVYTSTNVPVEITSGVTGDYSSTLTVPGHPRIGRLRVGINLQHSLMADLDVELRSPSGNVVALFNDIGTTTVNPGLSNMSVILDDHAAIPLANFTVVYGMMSKPESVYRLDSFKGQDAGGEWTLTIRDDLAANGGTLDSWSLEICEEPLTTLVDCPDEAVVFSTDFEANDGGFTSSGVENEWQHGVPSFAPIDTAFSGVNVWATDLVDTYNRSSNQDLHSPQIDLTGATAPIYLRWAQQHQMQDAVFDGLFIDLQSLSGGPDRRLFEWKGGTMAATVGNPGVTIPMSAGWAMMEADISEYAGQVIQVRFNLTSNAAIDLAGLAIDDFSVVACANTPSCPADWDQSGAVNSSDISAFLTAWLASVTAPDLAADFNADGVTNSSDISSFLTAWLDAVVNGC